MLETNGWLLSRELPRAWDSYLQQFAGGLFHTPAGLLVGAPAGREMFGVYRTGGDVRGVAVGVRSGCRLSRAPRHVYFGAPPAVAEGVDRLSAVDALLGKLAEEPTAEVTIDSFDAVEPITSRGAPEARRTRHEYVVELVGDDDEILRKFGTTHRRYARRGEREKLKLRELSGDEAVEALETVQLSAAERAELNGRAFHPHGLTRNSIDDSGADGQQRWGVKLLAAFKDEDLLATILVGWGGERVYYAMGGSTPLGYRLSAAHWLQWKSMCHFAQRGFRCYNLGGTSAAAGDPDDPNHGLHRFKTGFGADIVECRGGRWVLQPRHLKVHQAVGWLGSRLRDFSS